MIINVHPSLILTTATCPIGPPEGYELTQLSVVDTDPNLSSSRTDVPYNLIFTTLPPVPMERNYVDFPDGFTECAVPRKSTLQLLSFQSKNQ